MTEIPAEDYLEAASAAGKMFKALQEVRAITAEMTRTGREATFGLRLYEAVNPILEELEIGRAHV